MANVARLATRQRAFIARCLNLGERLADTPLNEELMNEAYNLVILQLMADLRANGNAELPGVGKFRSSDEPERTMTSPLTGTVTIAAHKRVKYKPEKVIHKFVNGS